MGDLDGGDGGPEEGCIEIKKESLRPVYVEEGTLYRLGFEVRRLGWKLGIY